MSHSKELTAEYVRTAFSFRNDDGTTHIIGIARTADGASVTVKGDDSDGDLHPGMPYRFYGVWRQHQKYGEQFSFASFIRSRPLTVDAIAAYINRVGKLGPVTSRKIAEQYGDAALETLRTDPDAVAESTPRLTPEKAASASVLLREAAHVERATAELMEIVNGRGFPRNVVDLSLKKWGARAADVVRRNPYMLLQFRGCGFGKVDQLYCDLGKNPATWKRQALCIADIIRRDGSGDTWHDLDKIRLQIGDKISGADVDINHAVVLGVRGRVLQERVDGAKRYVADYHDAEAESRLSRSVARITSDNRERPWIHWPDVMALDLSEHQASRLSDAFSGRLGILAGRPGTGKTYTVARIVRHLRESGIRHNEIAIAAPTGKAALRARQSMAAAGINAFTSTIHSLLEPSVYDGAWSFARSETHPIEAKFLFVDESSMIDTNLAASLFAAIGPETHVLLIGDIHQLPPVGHGSPLRDMITAGVPCGELTEIRRNSGRIVRACHEIVDHRRYSPARSLDVESGENLAHAEARENIIEATCKAVERIAAKFDLDAKSGIQVLTPTNAMRKQLNTELQKLLNPRGESLDGYAFRVGDKVIATKNEAVEALTEDGDEISATVANGEQGIVVSVSPGKALIKLEGRDVIVSVRVARVSRNSDDGGDSDSTGCSWNLAYAISCHKSQGSEWPAVIVVADRSCGRIMSRQLVYTAISRASMLCLTIGERGAIDQAMRRDGAGRQTHLAELIIRDVGRLARRRVAERFRQDVNVGDLLEGVL